MPTNNAIQEALFTLLNDAALGYQIAWPGVNFTPPASGIWLEPDFIPNRGIDNGIPDSSSVAPQGIFRVMVVARPGGGIVGLTNAAQAVADALPKGTSISGLVRVSAHPWQQERVTDGDKIMIAVSIPYSA